MVLASARHSFESGEESWIRECYSAIRRSAMGHFRAERGQHQAQSFPRQPCPTEEHHESPDRCATRIASCPVKRGQSETQCTARG